jgi:hypothetical protein
VRACYGKKQRQHEITNDGGDVVPVISRTRFSTRGRSVAAALPGDVQHQPLRTDHRCTSNVLTELDQKEKVSGATVLTIRAVPVLRWHAHTRDPLVDIFHKCVREECVNEKQGNKSRCVAV